MSRSGSPALGGEADDAVALAVALAVRALRGGSVCVDLLTVADEVAAPDLPWPSPDGWLAAVGASPLHGNAFHLYDDRLLYLDRYWREEELVAQDLQALAASSASEITEAALDRLFPPEFAEQRSAAQTALSQSVTVLTGGPGTGKTTTVARLLALVAEADGPAADRAGGTDRQGGGAAAGGGGRRGGAPGRGGQGHGSASCGR